MRTFPTLLSGLGLLVLGACGGAGLGIGDGGGGEPMHVALANPALITVNAFGAAATYPSTIEVQGMPSTLTHVQVTLSDVRHSYLGDLQVVLVSPSGRTCLVMGDCGAGAAVLGLDLTFDDDAAGTLPPTDASGVFSGTYRPSDHGASYTLPADANLPAPPYGATLSTFVGENPNGTWRLYVADDGAGDEGLIDGGWGLVIDAS